MFMEVMEHGGAFAECQRAQWKTHECWGKRRAGEEVATSLTLLIESYPGITFALGRDGFILHVRFW